MQRQCAEDATGCSPPPQSNHEITEQLSWKGLKRPSDSNPLLWAGCPLLSGCPEPHVWPWAPPRTTNPQLRHIHTHQTKSHFKWFP